MFHANLSVFEVKFYSGSSVGTSTTHVVAADAAAAIECKVKGGIDAKDIVSVTRLAGNGVTVTE